MMPIPGGELIIGFAVQVIIGAVVWAVKATWRALRCCVFDHPILTLCILRAGGELGWWLPLFGPTIDMFMWSYYPLMALGLCCVAIARFVADGGPAAVRRDARRAGRWVRDAAMAATAAEFAVERREQSEGKRRWIWSRGHTKDGPDANSGTLPPPPEPMPMGPGGGQVIDVHEVAPATAPHHESAGGDPFVTSNERKP
jgi:hypothetical protein